MKNHKIRDWYHRMEGTVRKSVIENLSGGQRSHIDKACQLTVIGENNHPQFSFDYVEGLSLLFVDMGSYIRAPGEHYQHFMQRVALITVGAQTNPFSLRMGSCVLEELNVASVDHGNVLARI